MLVASPATAKHKAKFALATDGRTVEAQNLLDEAEPPLVCGYADLGDHFGYFLALAGITTVRQIRENAFDIKATGRLNRLDVELLKTNPGWDAADRREDLNHFFARLIFCFFAEDTGIFLGEGLFTATLRQMTDPDGSNTAWVLSEIFRAMDTKLPSDLQDRSRQDRGPAGGSEGHGRSGCPAVAAVLPKNPSAGDSSRALSGHHRATIIRACSLPRSAGSPPRSPSGKSGPRERPDRPVAATRVRPSPRSSGSRTAGSCRPLTAGRRSIPPGRQPTPASTLRTLSSSGSRTGSLRRPTSAARS